ncbi:MAG: hypothetical protein QGH62_05930 [Nitrospinaceae bacterium]|nr:hypothetical protein [Nitrospinaceae bacterium]
MLTKLLFTLAIITAVLLFYQFRRRQRQPLPKTKPTQEQTPWWSTPHFAVWLYFGLLVGLGIVVFAINWINDHQVLDIRVINGSTGEAILYQAERKMVEGRHFQTLDGRKVTIGESERMEITEQE